MAKNEALNLKTVASDQLYLLGETKMGSPVLPLMWAHLGTPQNKNPKYDGKHGMFRFDLAIDPNTPDGAKFKAKLEDAHDEMLALIDEWHEANPKVKVSTREELNLKYETDADGNDTGRLLLKFKKPAKRFDKRKDSLVPNRIPVVDTKGNPVPKSVLDRIGNGTTIQVLFRVRPYYMTKSVGSSVSIDKIRLVDLKEYGAVANDADYFDSDFAPATGSFDATAVQEDEFDTGNDEANDQTDDNIGVDADDDF